MRTRFFSILFLSLFCNFFSNTLIAQRKKEERIKAKNLQNSIQLLQDTSYAAFFNSYTIPEDFKQYGAIIIAQRVQYIMDGQKTTDPYHRIFRRKVVVNDASALEDFSTIYFDIDLESAEDKIAIKLIKKGGAERTLTAADAMLVEKGNIPSMYRNADSKKQETYYKLAIPEIEVGDTLEYSLDLLFKPAKGNEESFNLPIVYHVLESNYPVVKQRISFEFSKHFYLLAQTLHGASAMESYQPKNASFIGFQQNDSNRISRKEEKWIYNYRHQPLVKFAVVGDDRREKQFHPERNVYLKSEVDTNDITEYTNTMLKRDPRIEDRYFGTLFKRLLRKGYTEEEKIDLLYQLLRFYIRRSGKPEPLGDEYFTTFMYKELREQGIPVSLVAIPNRTMTEVQNLLFAHELLYGIQYKNEIIFAPQALSKRNDPSSKFEGQKGFIMEMDSASQKVTSIREITIPVSNASKNIEINKKQVAMISDNLQQLRVTDTGIHQGLLRRNYSTAPKQLQKLLIEEDQESIFDMTPFVSDDESEALTESKREEENRKTQTLKKTKEEELLDEIKEGLNTTYDGNIDSVELFVHKKTGTGKKDTATVDRTIYLISGLVRKLGNNYMVELGKLLGSQIEISALERNRKAAIHMEMAKTLQHRIYFTIPEGYTAEGTENFNLNVDNPAGSFRSRAEIRGSSVYLETEKVYKKNFYKTEEWDQLVAMLDVAFNLTQKSFVLRKKE